MAATSFCNFNWGVNGKGTPEQPCSSSKSSQILFSSNLSFCYSNIRYCLSLRSHQTLLSTRFNETKNSAFVVASAKADPLKIMISGAPASGKGTQCELITKKENRQFTALAHRALRETSLDGQLGIVVCA